MAMEYTDMDFSTNRDQTKLLDFAINNLVQSLLWGVILAFLVMFLFLKDVRSPILIGISVPVSMVVCLLFFHLFHISINIISLSGLVLGTGLMIDNSIIVIDNIAQYREKGHSLSKACILGTNEVFRPLLSSVLTTCAVFVPLIFLSGITGELFYDQAMAITIGLFVSLLVSIALLPVLYRLFYVKGTNRGRITRLIQKWNTLDYSSLYEKGFRSIMRKQPIAFGIFILLSVMTLVLFVILPKSQMPELTSTETLLRLDWNEPINVGENKKRILELLRPVGDTVRDYTVQVGRQQFLLDKDSDAKPSEATLYIRVETPKDLVRIKNSLHRSIMEKYPTAVVQYGEVDNIFNLIFSDGTAPLTVRLRNVESIGAGQGQQLINLRKALQDQLSNIELPPIAWEDHTTLLADREKMILYGVSADLVGNTLKSAFNEREILSIIDNQYFVPVILGSGKKTIREVLHETMLRANDSTYYNLDQFVTLANSQGLKTITAGKEGEYYSIDLDTDVDHEDSTMAEIRSVVDQNSYYDVLFTGSLAKDRALVKELAIVMCITLLMLYFILASQFESLTLPLVILFEIPLSMTGAFLFLLFFGMGINLMSMIGIVVMSGIVINDSILKIDTIIQLQRQGNGLMRSLLLAGQRRLKPILMTSLTTILALVPILFTSGLGGELQAPLAVALIGGMLLGTVVSLYFIPLCYYYLAKMKTYAL
jgi:multidrug efflux pump subunit AcrB